MNEQRSSEQVRVGDVQIEVIARVLVRVEDVCGVIVGVALKVPIAVVVRSPAGTWEVDLEGDRERERHGEGAADARPAA